MAAKFDHDWYEKAADVLANESSKPAEKLAVLNELWGEYCFIANRKVLGFTVSYELPDVLIGKMINDALESYTGYTLAEIIEFAKEKIANGTKGPTETHETAANAEQLG